MKLLPRVSPNSVMNGHSENWQRQRQSFPNTDVQNWAEAMLLTTFWVWVRLFFLNRVTQHFKSLGTGSTLNEWNQFLPRAINMPNENPSIRNWLPSYELLARDAPDVSQTLERLLSPWLVAFQILTVKPCYWRHHMLWFQSMENKAGSELEAPSLLVSLHRVTQCIQAA